MFDNLRDDSSFYEEEQNDSHKEPVAEVQAAAVAPKKRSRESRMNRTT